MRAVGRIVVCVDADAEVSTEKSSSFCRTPMPNTRVPSPLSTSFWLATRNFVPASACAAVATIT